MHFIKHIENIYMTHELRNVSKVKQEEMSHIYMSAKSARTSDDFSKQSSNSRASGKMLNVVSTIGTGVELTTKSTRFLAAITSTSGPAVGDRAPGSKQRVLGEFLASNLEVVDKHTDTGIDVEVIVAEHPS